MKIASTLFAMLLCALTSPASAQWTRVTDVHNGNVFSIFATGDTLLAAADSVVFISTSGGTSWKESARVVTGAPVVVARVHGNRIYAGVFKKGVFFSTNLGDTWNGFNQGLVGAPFDTQLDVTDLLVDNNKMYAGTGAGVWKRDLIASGTWGLFGNIFAPDQSENINSIVVGNGTRLLACAGSNGIVFIRDPGDSEWTESFLNNVGLGPGHSAQTSIWTGSQWLVGEASGVLHSTQGQSPWALTNIGIGTLQNVVFALKGTRTFAAFKTTTGATFEYSDDGLAWTFLDFIPGAFVLGLAVHHNTLYAAQTDGLWIRDISTVATHHASLGSLKALYRKPNK